MRKPRNSYVVLTVTRQPGKRPTFENHPAVATEEKAKRLLESLDANGFIKYNGEVIWQYSLGASIFPPRWIDRRG